MYCDNVDEKGDGEGSKNVGKFCIEPDVYVCVRDRNPYVRDVWEAISCDRGPSAERAREGDASARSFLPPKGPIG